MAVWMALRAECKCFFVEEGGHSEVVHVAGAAILILETDSQITECGAACWVPGWLQHQRHLVKINRPREVFFLSCFVIPSLETVCEIIDDFDVNSLFGWGSCQDVPIELYGCLELGASGNLVFSGLSPRSQEPLAAPVRAQPPSRTHQFSEGVCILAQLLT